jgi:hypothetical protein
MAVASDVDQAQFKSMLYAACSRVFPEMVA